VGSVSEQPPYIYLERNPRAIWLTGGEDGDAMNLDYGQRQVTRSFQCVDFAQEPRYVLADWLYGGVVGG